MDQPKFIFLVERNVGIISKIVYEGRESFKRDICPKNPFIKKSAFFGGMREQGCSFESSENSKKHHL